jgi:hypothetical protein
MERTSRAPRIRLGLAALVGSLLIASSLIGATVAAPAPQRATPLQHLDKLAAVGKNLIARVKPEARAPLSMGAQQLVNLAKRIEEVKAAKKAGAQGKASGPKQLPQGYGSDPYAAEDLTTRLGGMTQSETSAGWCGDNAAIGFNDSGSLVATIFLNASPSGSFSVNGWSRSRDRGASYTDMGVLIADPLPAGIMFRDLLGDPLIGCSSSSAFYYGSLAIDSGFDFSFVNSGISVSRSTDGAASFGPAIMAVSKDGFTHFLDKPWMSVDAGPTASAADDRIYITYTDFDFSGFENPEGAACPNDQRTAIEAVRSTDGGTTWSAPVVLEAVCGFESFLQGSQVEAGLGNDVYVAWEHYTNPFSDRDIRIARSSDGGATFGSPQIVTAVTPVGDSFALQGLFRDFLDLQGLAVDRSSGAARGTVYISWQDGRNRSKADPFGFCGATPTYCFGDVFVTRSTGGGATWSAPVRVNDDDVTLGIDQFMPALDVDNSGSLWVAYYDRRRDNRNFLIDTFVAKSTNGGQSWANNRVTNTNFAPVTGWQDVFINPVYMGDYIAVTADKTGTSPGIIAAWGDNSLGDANVLQARR